MRSSTLFILLLAFTLLVPGCAKKEVVSSPSIPTSNVVDVGAAEVLGQDIALDSPEDPGTLDDLPVSDDIPQ